MAPTQEGGGEAMVAIIQGLRDAGLAVTLMSAPRGYFSQRPVRGRRVSGNKASVETNTEWPRRTHSAQICDSHYATSYQLAHCRLNPTPPSPDLPEFPIQRGAPSRSRGNFRVGQCDSGGSTKLKHSRSRGTFSYGSVFAASLRNYPLDGRSASTELVHRLLKFTQDKYLSKNPSRSMRSLHSPRTSHNKCNKSSNKSNKSTNKSANKCGKLNKVIQTYTRMVNEVVKEKVQDKTSKKNVSVEATLSTNPLDQPNQSYSYSKPPSVQSPAYTSGSEVRYLSDVRRVIRDTVRQMVDGTSTVPCTKAACRYKEHKRLHHRCDSATSPLENELEGNPKDSQISENYVYLKDAACHRPSCTEQRERADAAGQCSELRIEEVKKFIQKTVKQMVDCNPTCSKKLSICKDKQLFKETVSTPTQIQEEEDEEELREEKICSGSKVDAQTSDADVCPETRSAVCRKVLSRYLQHRKLYHDEELEDDDDEKEEVKSLDFCYPPPKTKPSFFSLGKPCICDDDKKKHDSINDVMVYDDDSDEYSTEAIDVDIEQLVMAWITKLPVYMDNTEENQAKILEMAQKLIEELNALNDRPDYDERALEKIQEFLDQLPYPNGDNSRAKTPRQEEKDEDDAEFDELIDIISRWLDCLYINPRNNRGIKDLVEEFIRHLKPMIEKNETPKKIKTKVLALLDDTAQVNAIDTQDEDLSKHVDDLVSELHYLALRRNERKNKLIRKKFLEPIYEWLIESDVPEAVKEKHRHSASITNSKLRQLVANGADEDAMDGVIQDFLRTMSEDALQLSHNQKSRLSDLFKKQIKYGLSPMSSNEKLQVANDLLKKLLPKANERKEKTFESKQPVLDWLKSNPYIEEEDKENYRKLAKQLNEKLEQIRSEKVDGEEVENEINEFLHTLSEKGITITPAQRTALAKRVRNKMKSLPITRKKTPFSYNKPMSNWLDNVPNIPKQVKEKNKKLVQDFDEKLQEMKSQDLGKEVIKDEITEFSDSLSKKGVPLLPKQKNNIARNILKELQSAPPETESSKQPATDWFENASSIPKQIKQKHRNLVKDFDEKLQEMNSQDLEKDVIKDVITEFLDSLSKKGVPLLPKQKNDIARNIFKELQSAPPETESSEQPATDWFENALSIPKQIKQKHRNLVKDFDEKLQEMKSRDDENDDIEDKIGDFIDTLSQKGVPISPNHKSEIAKTILKGLKPSLTKPQPSTNPASEWLENAPNVPNQVKQNNKNLARDFDERLQEMKYNNVDDVIIEEEIYDFLDTLSRKGASVSPKQKSDIARIILKGLKSMPTNSQTSKPSASAWLKNAPNISKQVKEKNKNVLDNFERKIQLMKTENVDEDVIKDEINEFMDSLPAKGIKVTPSERAALANIMLDVKQSKDINKQPLTEWFVNAKNIPEAVKQKNKNMVENFDKKLQEMNAQNVADDIIEDEINEFMETLTRVGVPISSKQKRDITKNLIKESKCMPTKSQTKKPAVSAWLENAPNIPKQVKDRNKNAFDNFEKKIQQMKAENVDQDVIQDEINEFIDSLPAKGVKVTTSEKAELAETMIKEIKPSIISNKQPTTKWFENAKNIPEAVKQKNKNLVEDFDKKLQEMKFQNVEDEIIEDEINDFLDTLSRKGVPLSPKQKSDLKNLINEHEYTPIKSQTSKPQASSWLENAPNIPKRVKDRNKNAFDNFQKKIQQTKAENVDQDVIRDETNEFVNSFPAKGTKVTLSEKGTLAQTMLEENVKPGKVGSKQATTEWFENAENIPEAVKQQNKDFVKNFDKKLQAMKSKNVGDDILRDEVNDFLDTLSIKGVALSPYQKRDIIKIVLKDPLSTSAETQPASEWLENATNIPEQTKQKHKNFVNDFDKKIQQMRANNIDEETIHGEINEFIDSLSRKGINLTPQQKNELSQIIIAPFSETREVQKRPTMSWATSTPKQAKEQEALSLSEWLEKSQDITKQTKDKNRNLFDNFDKKMKQMKANDVDENVIQNEINEFVNSFPEEGIKLSPKEKQELKSSLKDWSDSSKKSRDDNKQGMKSFYEDKFVKSLTRNPNKLKIEPITNKIGYSSTSDRSEITGIQKPASEWLESSADIPKEWKLKHRKFFKKFDKELNKLKSDKASDHAIENKIRNFLGDLPNKGISVTPKEKDRLRKSLLDVPEDSSRTTVRPVTNWLDSSMDISEREKNKTHDIVDNFDDILQRLRAGNATEEEIEAEISDFLDILKQLGIGMTPQEKAQLIKKFLAESKMMLKRLSSAEFSSLAYSDNTPKRTDQTKRKGWSQDSDLPSSLKPGIRKAIKDGVNSVLDKYDIPSEFRDEVEKNIGDALADALSRGTSDTELEKTLMDILKNAGVSEDEAKRIVADLMKKKKQIAKDFKTLDPEMKKKINNEVGNILDKYDIPSEYREAVEKSIANALADALSHGTSDKELETTLMNILKNAGVSEDEAKRIVADLMKKKKQIAKDFKTLDPEMKKKINNEVGNILDKYDIPSEYREAVEKSIANALADALSHGTSDKELETTLMNILKNAGVSEDEAKRIVTDLMEKKKQIAKDFKTLDPEIKKKINNEVGNILDKYDIPSEYREAVEKSIANALADALSHGTSDKELETTLMNILKNAGVSEDEAKRIVADLMKKKKQIAKDFKTLDPEMKKKINNEVGNILDKYDIPSEYREAVEKSIANALANALSHGTSDKELETTLMNILKNAGVSEDEAKRIVTDLMEKKKQIAKDFKTLDPEIKKKINNEVGNILDKYDIPSEYREAVEKSIANALADALSHGTSDKELETTLMNILKNAGVSEDEAKRIVADLMKKKKQIAKDFKTLDPEMKKKINNEVGNILDKYDIPSEYREAVEKSIANALANALSHGTSDKELETTLMNILKNAGVSEDEAKRIVTDLMEKKKQMLEASQDQINRLLQAPEKFINYAVDKWTKSLTLPAIDKISLDRAKQGLAETLKAAFVSNGGRIPPSQEDEIFQDAVANFLDDVPGHSYTIDDEKLLADSLKDIFKESDKNFAHPKESGYKKGADVLLDDIRQWVESLPFECNTPEEKENADKMKQDIKGNLIHKIGELNMNPEIFNDDFLYEDMLVDEVDRLLLNTGNYNVKKQLPKLRKNFLDIVRKGKQKIHDENAAQLYKQQLKDAVARTLPFFQFKSPEELASLQVLKDDVADDFINMHYVSGDPNEINKLKNKINGDIYDYCMKHLRRCPAAPLDTRHINQALYPALESIPEPQNDSFRYEVEHVKAKDIIKNWIKDLPLGYQSGLKKLQTNKIISVLAKKLLDIENEQLDADEHDDKLKKEIIRFLNKLPLNTNSEEELDEFANDILQRLKVTQELRKKHSALRHCIDACFRPYTYRPPPCTLSQEDLEHVDRIKQRNRVRRKISFKDACLSPCSAETSTQTKLRNLLESCPGLDIILGRRSFSVQTYCRRMQAVGSQVCPNVIINEHNCESGQTRRPTESSISPCEVPMPCTRRSQSPNRPSLRPKCTSRHSEIQQWNRPSYCQTSPKTSNCQTQCEPHYQEPPTTPTRARIPSRPTQCRPEQPLRMQFAVDPCAPHRPAQNIPQRRSRDDSYISEPSQAVFSREDQNNRPVSAHPSPRNVCKPPAQRNMRYSGFTICDRGPEAGIMAQRRLCQGNQENQRKHRCPDPCMMSSHQVPGPSYQTQSSDLNSSSQDQSQPCYKQPYFMSSTPISSEDLDPFRFKNRVTRVIHLGSFETPNFPNFNPNSFEYEYWDTEHRSNPSGNEESPRKKCRCKPKCGKYKGRRKPCHLANDEAMSNCAKCRGVHCPFPSYMFFG